MRVGRPLRRQASSTSHVPSMFERIVCAGSRRACSTIVCAPRWNTASISYSARTRSTRRPSRRSPKTVVQRLPAAPV